MDLIAMYEALTCKKDSISFQAGDGAGAHCEASATGLFEQMVFDWINKIVKNYIVFLI